MVRRSGSKEWQGGVELRNGKEEWQEDVAERNYIKVQMFEPFQDRNPHFFGTVSLS